MSEPTLCEATAAYVEMKGKSDSAKFTRQELAVSAFIKQSGNANCHIVCIQQSARNMRCCHTIIAHTIGLAGFGVGLWCRGTSFAGKPARQM